MKHLPSRSICRKKEQKHPNIPSSLFPLLVCKKTEMVSIMAHAVSFDKVDNKETRNVNVMRRTSGRRLLKIDDLRVGKSVALTTEGSRGKDRKPEVAPKNKDQKQLDQINIIKPSVKQRAFRARKLEYKSMRYTPNPELQTNHTKSIDLNNCFSECLMKSATPTQVLYLNNKPGVKNGIAILNVNNFSTNNLFWKGQNNEQLARDFKEILQSMSQEFSLVLRSEQTSSGVGQFLQKLNEWEVEILAWINVSKAHSTYNKVYNLSEVLNVIGTLTKVWVFEGQADAASEDISKQIMLPVFQQSANLSLVLFKLSQKQSLAKATSACLSALPAPNNNKQISFKEMNKASLMQHHILQFEVVPRKQTLQYDVDHFKNKLIQYMKILKNQRRTSSSHSINYLVGDLIKRNFNTFQAVLGSEPQPYLDLNLISQEAEQLQSKYQIQILSF